MSVHPGGIRIDKEILNGDGVGRPMDPEAVVRSPFGMVGKEVCDCIQLVHIERELLVTSLCPELRPWCERNYPIAQ